MELVYVPKQPDKAYVADRLWLPKSGVRAGPVQKALEFTVNSRGEQVLLRMWEESSRHLICPREFLPFWQYPKYKFPFVDLRPQFSKISFEDGVKTRDEKQERGWQALSQHDNGIFNQGCGQGKTVLGIKKIAQRGTPTLVVVPDGGILEQWKKAILGDPAKGLKPFIGFDGELGIIQGPVFNWARPITLALVTTLWMRIEQGAVPEEMFRYFGFILYDEVHIIGAPKFSLTASPFYGDRIGLTATVEREDGLDPIYRYHLGEPFYSDLSQDLVPKIYFQKTPASFDYRAAVSETNVTNVSILRTILGKDLVANTFRYWNIKAALDAGRKILCLSHSKNQLRLFHAMFPGSGLIIAETSAETRTDILRNSRICFAIAKLGGEGVDDDGLDTLFWLTPGRSRRYMQQSMGRIQRRKEGKKTPVMVIFEDWMIPTLKKMCSMVRSIFKEWHFAFETLKPTQVPQTLPEDVRALYDAAMANLPKEKDDEGDDE
jgi:superfamily II DNA or RNA helicase